VYYINEMLSETKARYPQIQKLLYAVVLARRKLRHYFEAHPVTVVSSLPLGEIIRNLDAAVLIAKWSVELMGGMLTYASRKAIKSQILADFVAEWTDTQLSPPQIQAECWTLYFDGSVMKTGAGVGLLFISPLREHMSPRQTTWQSTRPFFVVSESPSRQASNASMLGGLATRDRSSHEECELSRRQDGGLLQRRTSPRRQVLRHRA
jgi:hypothetical protein